MSALKKTTVGETIFDWTNILGMILLCAIMLYPFAYVISRSVMTDAERAARPYSIIPRQGIDTEGYEYLFGEGTRLGRAYLITLFRTIVGTVLSVLVSAMFAYALSKKYYPLRGVLTVMIAITMWFGAGLIPKFLVVRAIGLYNSIWVYVLVPLTGAWTIIIMRTFFSRLPDSLEESAKLDGCNDFGILFRIVFPLSTALLATMSLFSIVYHWNEWFMGIVFVADPKKQPVQVLLWQTLKAAIRMVKDETWAEQAPPAKTVQMALIVVTSFPIVVSYPFFQKYFVKGMLIGSIKG